MLIILNLHILRLIDMYIHIFFFNSIIYFCIKIYKFKEDKCKLNKHIIKKITIEIRYYDDKLYIFNI